MPSSELEEMQTQEAPEAPAGEALSPEAQPFEMDEFETPAPGGEAASEEEKDGFRLLVVGGRHEDPAARAEREAAQIIDNAQAQLAAAQEGVAAAQAEADDIRKKAYEEGYGQGEKEGSQAMKVRMEAAAGDLGRGLQNLEQTRAAVLGSMEPEVLALVQSICARFFFTPQAVAPEVVRNVVKQSLLRVSEAEKIEVRLSPADLEIVKEYQPELEQDLNELKRMLIKADPELSPGDCLVFSPTAQVDATLESRRQRIFTALEDALHGQGPLDLAAAASPQDSAEPADDAGQSPDASPELENW